MDLVILINPVVVYLEIKAGGGGGERDNALIDLETIDMDIRQMGDNFRFSAGMIPDVPDGRLRGWGHPWGHGWPWESPRIMSWRFRGVIFIFGGDIKNRCFCEKLCQEGGRWEASWRKTWRTGSSLRSWMTLGESKDHILKVSWHYLYFWRRYKKSVFLRKSVTYRRTNGRTDGQTLLKFNID